MKRSFWFKLLCSLFFLWLIFRGLARESILDVFGSARPALVLGSVLVSFMMVAISCWKWQLLLKMEGDALPYGKLFRYYLVGYYYTCLLPSNVGGDVARAWLTGRETGRPAHAVLAVFLERVTGLLLLLILSLSLPWLAPALFQSPAVWAASGLALALFVFLLGSVFIPRPGVVLTRIASLVLPALKDPAPQGTITRTAARLISAVQSFHDRLRDALKAIGNRRRGWVAVLALTALFYAITWLNVWISFQAFGIEVPWKLVLAVTPVSMLVAGLPLAPFGGLGLTEGAFVLFFKAVGIAPSASLAMALLLRLKLVFLGLLGMLVQFESPAISNALHDRTQSTA